MHATTALLLMAEPGKRLQTRLMIAMDTQQGRRNARHQLFCLVIAPMQVEVETCVAQYDDSILGRERIYFAEANQISRIAVYVASDISHFWTRIPRKIDAESFPSFHSCRNENKRMGLVWDTKWI